MYKEKVKNLWNSAKCILSALAYVYYDARASYHVDNINKYSGDTDVKTIEWLHRYHTWRADVDCDRCTVLRNAHKVYLKRRETYI